MVSDKLGNILFVFVGSDPPFYNEINSGKLRYPIHLVDRVRLIGLCYDLFAESCSTSCVNKIQIHLAVRGFRKNIIYSLHSSSLMPTCAPMEWFSTARPPSSAQADKFAWLPTTWRGFPISVPEPFPWRRFWRFSCSTFPPYYVLPYLVKFRSLTFRDIQFFR